MGQIKLFDDIDDILEAWLDLFLHVVEQHVSIKQHRVKCKNQPDRISPETLYDIKTRDRHKSLGNNKFWRNKVISLIKKLKEININHSLKIINANWQHL